MDAVFAGNDQMALGVLRAAHLAGRRVPDDLAVAGFDNIPESAYFWPPLTTVNQNLKAVGGEAVRALNELIDARLTGGPAPTLEAKAHCPAVDHPGEHRRLTPRAASSASAANHTPVPGSKGGEQGR